MGQLPKFNTENEDLFLVNLKVVKERPENKRGQASWNQVPLSVFPAGADEIRDIRAHELLQDRLDTPCKQQKEEKKENRTKLSSVKVTSLLHKKQWVGWNIS